MPARRTRRSGRILDARPDTTDFRDRMFVPTLVETPTQVPLEEYRQFGCPILDQGDQGACTGFGLAAVAHFLLRAREVFPDERQISPWMLYTLARRYDEWPGENYEGSSARGAMKGWHKHGVCALDAWPSHRSERLTQERVVDAMERPLGAYFRVNHKDLVAMHSAISEVGILYATAVVHAGWDAVRRDGVIPQREQLEGGHAFAIVGYERRGFWIQNSWGEDWGKDGFALVTYADWLQNGTDVWVARLGVPVELGALRQTAVREGARSTRPAEPAYAEVRPHVVSLGNDGTLRETGTYGTSKDEVRAIFRSDIPRITRGWDKKRIVLWAHGGLVSESAAIRRVSEYRDAMLETQIYPLAFSWKSDYWTTLINILEDAVRRRRPEGFLDAAKDFMLDRLDDALEPLARALTGRSQWKEMKENALLATAENGGGGRLVARELASLARSDPSVEIHLMGHSAGSILLAPLAQYLATDGRIGSGPLEGTRGLGLTVASCTLWAPACTIDLFKQTYLPAIESRGIRRFGLFTLTDSAERDDHCAHVYHKSLLYLVSAAFESEPRIPILRPDGVPLLGMAKFVSEDAELKRLFRRAAADWVKAPNLEQEGSASASTSRRHGDFDDDPPTVRAALARILGVASVTEQVRFARSPESLRDRRVALR